MPSILAWGLTLSSVFISAALAVGAGIGGGALFVAAYILILGMDAHGAVPLSKGEKTPLLSLSPSLSLSVSLLYLSFAAYRF
jgi:hypothetical protein